MTLVSARWLSQRQPNTGPAVPTTFDLLSISEIKVWFNADQVVQTAGAIEAWPNLRSMVNASQSVGANQPAWVEVDGRNWLEFDGDGVTPNVGAWLTSSEQALLTPTRYLNSEATYYWACTCQALITTGTEQTIFSVTDISESVNFNGFALNSLNRQARYLIATTGVDGLYHPVVPVDTTPHVVEFEQIGATGTLRVDGVITSTDTKETIGNQAAFDTFIFGATGRNSGFNTPGNARIRDYALAYPAPSSAVQKQIRTYLAERAGITLIA